MDKSGNSSKIVIDSKPSLLNASIQESIAGEAFWNMLQSEKGVEIPVYIKNILTLNNLDNPLSFQCINDETFRELEEFVRESMKDFLNKGDSLDKYYGRYQKIPNKFRFLIGDRYLVKKLVSFVKSKPDEFWKKNQSETLPFNQVYINGDIISESENEEPPKPQLPEGPPNREKEKQELLRLVLDSVRRDLKNYPDKLAIMEKVTAKVQVRRIIDRDSNKEQFISVGTIKCQMCAVTITIRKNHGKRSGRRARWIVSNFRRHIRKHLRNSVDSPSENDPDFKDIEVYKDDDSMMYNADETENQEDEDQNEVSYTVEW